MIKKITDDNYQEFKKNNRAAIVITTTSCGYCKDYKPVLETLSNQMPYINFGEITLDQGRVIQFKKDYKDIAASKLLPITLLMKEGNKIYTISGFRLYPDTKKLITDNLIIGSMVYYQQNGNIIPAKITYLADDKYILDAKGQKIEATKDQIKWNLEERL